MTLAIGPVAAALLTAYVLAEAGREVGFKVASNSASTKVGFAVSLLQEPALWFAIALGAIELVIWILILQSTPLAIAYPIVSLAYVVVPLAGILVLRERMTRRQAFGSLLIACGAMCVGLSGG